MIMNWGWWVLLVISGMASGIIILMLCLFRVKGRADEQADRICRILERDRAEREKAQNCPVKNTDA